MNIPQKIRRLFPWVELIFIGSIFAAGGLVGRCTAPKRSEKAIQAHEIAQALRLAADAIDLTNPPAK